MPNAQSLGASREADLKPYDLNIFFDGLIAFVPELTQGKTDQADRVWALLVDADTSGVASTTALGKKLKQVSSAAAIADWKGLISGDSVLRDLVQEYPPCVIEKILTNKNVYPSERQAKLDYLYPPHLTRLRFRNAEISGRFENDISSTHSMMGESIGGMDVRISDESSGVLQLDGFSLLGQVKNVRDSRSDPSATSFDAIDRKYIADDWSMAKRDHVAARVLLDAKTLGGATLAANSLGCDGCFLKYGFTSTGTGACGDADKMNPVSLAEDVTLIKNGLTKALKIRLATGRVLSVTAKDPKLPLTIEVLNVMKHAVENADLSYTMTADRRGCAHGEHLMAYGAFYWLARNLDPFYCAEHFIPCEANPQCAGGRKCPERLLVPES